MIFLSEKANQSLPALSSVSISNADAGSISSSSSSRNLHPELFSFSFLQFSNHNKSIAGLGVDFMASVHYVSDVDISIDIGRVIVKNDEIKESFGLCSSFQSRDQRKEFVTNGIFLVPNHGFFIEQVSNGALTSDAPTIVSRKLFFFDGKEKVIHFLGNYDSADKDALREEILLWKEEKDKASSLYLRKFYA